ncbi:probable cytochrome P450 12d1 proximal, mitochondrial isoform X5 [Hermetia illucens]|uniref:probable cytochrome P450 12d1 proximal, mitochondrial isoform X5 n=1 Tax=Hermetia illucens TaxID=343691 RepID=UPI0018CC1BB6|nr:probable cytochrome P450 12d1 proximal, mitochondrial isoform X5 [Hermetia illucens]
MFLRTVCRAQGAKAFHQNANVRFLATQVEAAKDNPRSSNFQNDYAKAIHFSKIPGPSKFVFLRSLMPGGKYYKMEFVDMIKRQREDYGDLFRFPGLFGGPEILFSFDPNDFETIFRTEGYWPDRIVLQTMIYYRSKVRPDIFGKYSGLGNALGKEWAEFRTAVNPAMAQPKNTKIYIPKVDAVAVDFVKRIHSIRDPKTSQVPENFEEELSRWAFESIALIAMDTRLGLISGKHDGRSERLIQASKDAARLLFNIEVKPALWRIVRTPNFRKLMKAYDTITNLSSEIVEEARTRLDEVGQGPRDEGELSVFEKLLKIDPLIAKIMAMDILFAGVDTTTASFTGLLYLLSKNLDKQEILRKEIMTILPEKESPLTVQNMKHLPYLRACIKESLRVQPPVNGLVRNAGQNIILSGYQIPKGTTVLMSAFVLQKEDKYYPNADKYEPERWLKRDGTPAPAKSAHPFIFLPFGYGPRMCIGRRFAEMQIETLIVRILRDFQVEWHHPDLKFTMKSANVPDGNLTFTFKDIVN